MSEELTKGQIVQILIRARDTCNAVDYRLVAEEQADALLSRRAEPATQAAAPAPDAPAAGKVVAWRYRNDLGEVVSEWIDGPCPEYLVDVVTRERVASKSMKIDLAYAAPQPPHPGEGVAAEGAALLGRMQAERLFVVDEYHAVCTGGRWDGWMMWHHPDGQWVSLRKLATADPFAAACPAGIVATETEGGS